MYKTKNRARGEHYAVFPSYDPSRKGQYFWRVTKDKNGVAGEAIECGYCYDFNTAFRAARNFMKNNQELVYGSNSQPVAA